MRVIHNGVLRKKNFLAFAVLLCCMFLLRYVLHRNPIQQPSCTEFKQRIYTKGEHDKAKGDILLGIRLTGRKGYSNFTASVIRKYQDVAESDITVFTTRAMKYESATLRNLYGKGIRISELASDATAEASTFDVFLRSKYKILFLIDSEMVFMPIWRDFITRHMITHRNIPFLSLYHSATMHSYTTACQILHGDLCKGKIVGKYGIAITKAFAGLLQREHSDILRDMDWNKVLAKENQHGLYPVKSLIMSIGQTNQDKNFCGNNDVPYGFKLCELPCWIRNGIEFYFDLCTSPQETYSPEISIRNARLENRLWTRPALVYSFYGNNARYVKGALENAKRVFTIYPGYKIWAYLDNSVASDVVLSLCSDNVKYINMTGTKIKNRMSWRFLIAAEPVRWFTILDIDYRVLKRGKEATDDWLRSGRKFHVMRDHPNHSKYPVNGMWGGYGNSIPNIKELILMYNADDSYMKDMFFLADKIWPIMKASVWAHDAYSIHKFGEDHPFPTERKGKEFVGSVDFIAE